MSVRTLDLDKANQPLADYTRELDSGPLVITQNGRPIAVVMALQNTDLETLSLSSNPQFLALIERSRTRQESAGGISSDEMRRLLDVD